MSVRDNLKTAAQEHLGTMVGRLFRRPDLGLDDKVDRLVERFRLAHVADERAANLSYGQQKLLDTAMAFVSDPAVVFLDEPAGGVNPSMLGDLKELIGDLNAARRHDLRRRGAQHGVHLRAGPPRRRARTGPPADDRHARTRYAANPRVLEVYLGG